jgi:hypothetical protein
MNDDTVMYVVWGAVLLGLFIWLLLAYWNRRLWLKRLLLRDLFNGYFRGDVSADQLGRRTRQIASHRFMGSPQFYSLAIAAFQSAADATQSRQPQFEAEQTKLIRLLAALKNEFGLTDRYLTEGWRAGRE